MGKRSPPKKQPGEPDYYIVQRGGKRYENPAWRAWHQTTKEGLARETKAKKAIQGATTLSQYNKALLSYGDTKYGKPLLSKRLQEVSWASHAYSQWKKAQQNGHRGSSINRAHSKVEMLLNGYSSKDFDNLVRWEDQNRKLALKQSAWLRAGGVKQNFNNPTFSSKPVLASADPLKFFSNPTSSNTMSARVTSTDPATAKANAEQKAYVASLRAGGVGIAEALLKPKTPQTYFVKGKPATKQDTSINLERFLTERGYDINKPELIPNSVFKPEKQLQARRQASQSPM